MSFDHVIMISDRLLMIILTDDRRVYDLLSTAYLSGWLSFSSVRNITASWAHLALTLSPLAAVQEQQKKQRVDRMLIFLTCSIFALFATSYHEPRLNTDDRRRDSTLNPASKSRFHAHKGQGFGYTQVCFHARWIQTDDLTWKKRSLIYFVLHDHTQCWVKSFHKSIFRYTTDLKSRHC